MTKLYVAIGLFFSIQATAYCGLSQSEIKEFAIQYLNSTTKGHLAKAYLFETYLPEGNATFTIQYKTKNEITSEDQITTRSIYISCYDNRLLNLSNDNTWSIPINSLHSLE